MHNTTYDTKLIDDSAERLIYLFESNGQRKIAKIIAYLPTKVFQGRTVYNLGFGDFDETRGVMMM